MGSLRRELKRAGKKSKKVAGNVLNPKSMTTRKGLRQTFRTLFGDKAGKKVWNYASNPFRALQRSHIGGDIGKTLAPSFSDRNLVSQAYNKAMSALSGAAARAASRMTASQVGNSASSADRYYGSAGTGYTAPKVDYSYRSLKQMEGAL